ncbi:MAG: glycosyltransferase family 2 protein [Armatimonadetes bacterium]|nr:glycosyltransferase family 2 protein [Armatimonadota bacterium]
MQVLVFVDATALSLQMDGSVYPLLDSCLERRLRPTTGSRRGRPYLMSVSQKSHPLPRLTFALMVTSLGMSRLPGYVESATVGQLGAPSILGCSIIIVTYNSAPTIQECLRSVFDTLRSCDEVIVVDNASEDATLNLVATLDPGPVEVKIIRLETNMGYARATNVGMRASRGGILILLNPDTIVWPRWTQKLVRAFSSAVGAVAPLSDRVAGIQYVGNFVEPHLHLNEIQDVLTERFSGQTIESKLLIGLCLALRRDVMNRIGLQDENLFLGNDDLELSWRLRTHGLQLHVAKDVFVQHHHHVSFDSVPLSQISQWLGESGEALNRKLERWFNGVVPSSLDLWGVEFC